jgi:isopentenyl phosphate kinase
MAQLIFVKLGGSAITNKNVENSINQEVLDQVSKEIAECNCKLLIGHGGGSFPHPVAEKYNVNGGIKACGVEGFMAVRKAVMNLGEIVMNSLTSANIPAIYLPTYALTIMKSGKVSEFFISPIEKLLENNKVPVLPGDACLDLTKGCSIASTEMIFTALAEKLKPQRIIIGTDVDGVLDQDGKLIPEINSSNLEETLENISNPTSPDVTGGMKHKIEELLKTKIETQIINLKTPGLLTKAINGETVGTILK